MAVDRYWKGQNGERNEATDWFSVEAWNRLGEICQEYLHKGSLVFVEGELHIDQWENDKGERQIRPKIHLRSLQMLDGRRNGGEPPVVEVEEEEEPVLA
jgi:single-strand DNA-binding protein